MYKRAALESLFKAIDEIKTYDLSAFPGELEEVFTSLITQSDELQAQENKLTLVAFDSKFGTSLHCILSPADAVIDSKVANALFPNDEAEHDAESWVVVAETLEASVLDFIGADMQEEA